MRACFCTNAASLELVLSACKTLKTTALVEISYSMLVTLSILINNSFCHLKERNTKKLMFKLTSLFCSRSFFAKIMLQNAQNVRKHIIIINK